MVLDSSALVAILLEEPGSHELAEKIEEAETVMIGAPTLFEAAMILQHRRDDGVANMTAVLRTAQVTVIPFGEEHYQAALLAFLQFGKGRHPAKLNILDCMAYATASLARLPLLYVGDDFAKTDIEAA